MHLTRRAFASTIAGAACLRGVLHAQSAARPAAIGSLTDVPGLRVGHWTDTRRPTGCTAILFDPDASVGVDYDGSAPGETGVVGMKGGLGTRRFPPALACFSLRSTLYIPA